MHTHHPSPDDLEAFGQGRLPAQAAATVEAHVAACDGCCRLLEEIPPDNFLGQLRHVRQGAAQGTTADVAAGTVTDAPELPPELADHPRYHVLGLVGRGGMGAVYRAEHRRMQRQVALKVIHPDLMRNPASVQRFQQEVRAAARLQHPNIVTAHDADQAGDLHFLVMEYVEGQSLAEVVQKRGPLPIPEACEYIRQSALGLQHAHEQGMVHRDIKPHNLMVVSGGVVSGEWSKTRLSQVKILDFGLARLAAKPEPAPMPAANPPLATHHSQLTSPGTVMGTADYLAPEQAADPRAADIRADIYSLGCTLFHLLTGRPPFPDGVVEEKLARHGSEPLPDLTKVRPEAPPDLAAVLARMTAKKPADRYAAPAEVALALTPFASGGTALPSSPAVQKPVTRRRRLLAAALVLLAAGIGTAIVVVLRLQTDRGEVVIETDDPSLKLIVQKGGSEVVIRDENTGKTVTLDTSGWRLDVDDWQDTLSVDLPGRGKIQLRRQGGRKVTITTAPKGPATPKERPVRVVDPVELAKLPNAADGLKRSDIPKDALAYLGGGDPKNVPPELVAVLGDTRFRCPERPGPMAFSPDGKVLAVSDDSGVAIRFLDVQTGRLLRQLQPSPFCYQMAFSPDGRLLAGTAVGGRLSVIDAESGKLLWKREPTKGSWVECFSFTPDGKSICLVGKKSRYLEQRDAVTGQLIDREKEFDLFRAFLFPANCSALAISPDGKHFAIAHKGAPSDEGVISIHGTSKGEDKLKWKGSLRLLTFTPDSRALVAVHIDGPLFLRRWRVANRQLLAGQTWPARWWFWSQADALSPDTKTLACRILEDNNQVQLFDTQTGEWVLKDKGQTAPVTALAFSPGGKLLASSNAYQTRLLDLATAREIAVWGECPYHRLAFSPDGRLLAGASGTYINIHQVADGKRLHSLDPRTQVESIAFSPDGSLLAATTGGDSVRIWRIADGKEIRILSYPNRISCVLFSLDGSKLLAGGHAGVKVWETASGLEVKHFLEGEALYLLEWLPDGKTLAARTGGYLFHVDPATGKVLHKEQLEGGLPVNRPAFPSNCFSPGARLLCEADRSGFVLTQLDSTPRRQRRMLLAPSPELANRSRAAAFSPDGRYLACGNPDGVLSLLRLSEQGKVQELQVLAPMARELADRPNAADTLKAKDVPEAARAYIGGGDPKNAPPELVAVFGGPTSGKPGNIAPGHAKSITALVFSPDGKLLASAALDSRICLWDLATGRMLRDTVLDKVVARLAFSPDSQYLATAADLAERQFQVRRVETLKEWFDFAEGNAVRVLELAWSPDGKLLATAGADNTVRVWSLTSLESIKTIGHRVSAYTIGWSPDGRLLASGSTEGTIKVWDRTTDKVTVGSFGNNWGVARLVFLPDARTLLASGGGGGRVWHMALQGNSWELKKEFRGPGERLGWELHRGGAAVGPDGRLEADCDLGGTLVLWQPDSDPLRMRTLRALPATEVSRVVVAFSPDGRYVAVGGTNGTISLLRLAERGRVPELPATDQKKD
jgi:WD40 repeat protein/serine/threonine protein kinase